MLRKFAIIASFPAFLLAARFLPLDRLPSTCGFLHITGYPCPSCGMTRSVMAISRLDFSLAAKMNPLGFILVGVLGLCWVIGLYEMRTGRRSVIRDWAARRSHLLSVIGVSILALFGLLRVLALASAQH